jgi:hypothetical protein
MKGLFLGCAALCGMVIMVVLTGKVIDLVVSHETIALISGVMVGVLVAAPCGVLVTYLAMSQRGHPRPPTQNFPQATQQQWMEIYRELALMQGRDPRVMSDESWQAPAQVYWRNRQ